MTITAHDIRTALAKWPSRYRTRDGREVVGDCVSRVSAALRDAGWRRVPRLDAYDLRQLGIEIVQAEYVNGGRPTGKFVDVAVIRDVDPEAAQKRKAAAEAQIGELCRQGKPVFYVWPVGGKYREGTRAELIDFLIRNNYA